MPEVALTVADLYQIIGQKEVVISQLGTQNRELQRQVAALTSQVAGQRALQGQAGDRKDGDAAA